MIYHNTRAAPQEFCLYLSKEQRKKKKESFDVLPLKDMDAAPCKISFPECEISSFSSAIASFHSES